MAHLALYREFRPKTFDEVVEQEHIVKTLKHQIQNDSINHAYLFCGTRGTGKTSIAKIFAKAVNCLSPKNGSPCGECAVCKSIESGSCLDVIEIDAASNNRVDEIRDLREKVGYLPNMGKYKVYIIDEVHMLTDSAFNALLKTLEEPPQHIIFILATTEPEKLPATILSRCMRFDFKLVSIEGLVGQLEKVFEKTGTKFEYDALKLIAREGRGSVRDTLSVAEMCKSFSGENVTYNSVVECLGLTNGDVTFEICKAIALNDGGKVLEITNGLYKSGKNLNVLLSDICEFFTNTLALKLESNLNIEVPENVKHNYEQIAELTSETFLLNCLKTLCDGVAQIKFAADTKIFVETLLLSLIFSKEQEIEKLKNRIEQLEAKIGDKSVFVQPQVEKQQKNEINSTPVQPKLADAPFEHNSQPNASIQKNAKQIFGEFIGFVRGSNEMLLYASLADIKSVGINNNTFVFMCATADTQSVLNKQKEFITAFLKEKYGINGFVAEIYVDPEKKFEQDLANMLDGKLKIE